MNAALRHDAPSGNAPDKAAQDNMPGNNAQQDAPQDDAAPQDALQQDAAASEKGKIDNRARLQEITAVRWDPLMSSWGRSCRCIPTCCRSAIVMS